MHAHDYPFSIDIAVRFRDIDAMGHVNNAVYFTYMETARIQFFASYFDIKKLENVPVILGEASCRYLSPAYYGETLTIGLGITRFGTRSFDMGYQMDNMAGQAVARARTTLIMFDYAGGISVPVPDSFKNQVHAMQGDWVAP